MNSNYVNKKTFGFSFSQLTIHGVFILFCLFCFVPLLIVLSSSFSNDNDIVRNGYSLIPEKFSTVAYGYIFKNPTAIINAYMVSIFVAVVGTVIGLLLTSMLAYTITRKDFRLRNVFSFMIFFTMLFNGGLVPWYILISRILKLSDKIFVLFIPYLVVPWFVFLMKGFLAGISGSIIESAKIDGAREITIFFKIILPISKPGLATVGFFYVLMYWNDWWLPLLFINNNKLVNIQYLLYIIMSNIEFLATQGSGAANAGINIAKMPDLSVRMATCVLAAGPMLFVFPFFQKYFVKGIAVGAIKG